MSEENSVQASPPPVSARTITLTYTEDDLNKILNTIAKLPYSECFTLIHNIQAQAQAQINQSE